MTEEARQQHIATATADTEEVLQLVLQLNNVQPPLDEWEIVLWRNLISQLVRFWSQQIIYSAQGNTMAAAWMARNVLELMIWIQYCTNSKENAKTFFEDRARDAFNLLDGLASLDDPTLFPELDIKAQVDATKKRMVTAFTAAGYTTLEDSYSRVHNAARAVGWEIPFQAFNRFLSKFAHPTAMMLFSESESQDMAEMHQMFVIMACIFASAAAGVFKNYCSLLTES